MGGFAPKLEILPESQQRLWKELGDTPSDFTLYGGTALALHLGHRTSVDFDFFGSRGFDPDELLARVPYLRKSVVVQKAPNTLACRVRRGEEVLVSFFGLPELGRVRRPEVVQENGLRIASLLDLAGTKAAVIQKRAQARDYLDIDALLRRTDIDLPLALAAAGLIYGSQYNPQITLKALSYFEDIPDLPQEIRARLARAVRQVDLDRLPRLEPEGPR